MACPKCGQPIRPTLRLSEKQLASASQTAVSASVSKSQPLNIENGLKTLIELVVIIFIIMLFLIDERKEESAILCIIACVGYFYIWGLNAFIALKHKDTGKIIILTFLPFIGILFCSFLMPKDDNNAKRNSKR